MPILEVEHLKKYFPVYSGIRKKITGFYKAVDDVSFSIEKGQTFGLVGESGCGKTTVGKSILRLIEPTSGNVKIDGREITQMTKDQIKAERKNLQMIFQDPYSSLNPRMTVKALISEPLLEHHLVRDRNECLEKVTEMMNLVGLNQRDIAKYPHEFSGGQRQRIMIARALAVSPEVIVCDEPVSALDVSIQAQILNLMQDIQEQRGVSYLFIAHGMPVVRHISNRIGVMYLGHLVEVADSDELFAHTVHPYSQALLSSIPISDPDKRGNRIIIKGEVPNLTQENTGCLFYNRCPYHTDRCKAETPQLKEICPGHSVACHLV